MPRASSRACGHRRNLAANASPDGDSRTPSKRLGRSTRRSAAAPARRKVNTAPPGVRPISTAPAPTTIVEMPVGDRRVEGDEECGGEHGAADAVDAEHHDGREPDESEHRVERAAIECTCRLGEEPSPECCQRDTHREHPLPQAMGVDAAGVCPSLVVTDGRQCPARRGRGGEPARPARPRPGTRARSSRTQSGPSRNPGGPMRTSLTNTGWANTNRSRIAAIANVVSARNSPRRRMAGHAMRKPTPPVTATATTRASTAGMRGHTGDLAVGQLRRHQRTRAGEPGVTERDLPAVAADEDDRDQDDRQRRDLLGCLQVRCVEQQRYAEQQQRGDPPAGVGSSTCHGFRAERHRSGSRIARLVEVAASEQGEKQHDDEQIGAQRFEHHARAPGRVDPGQLALHHAEGQARWRSRSTAR